MSDFDKCELHHIQRALIVYRSIKLAHATEIMQKDYRMINGQKPDQQTIDGAWEIVDYLGALADKALQATK